MTHLIIRPADGLLTVTMMAGPMAAAPVSRPEVEALLPAFEAYAGSTIQRWQMPGVAIGIVADDQLVYAKGFGVRELGGNDPVDADTVFQIGSTTKAFVATTEAILVDEGKIGWMDRVIDHDPSFRLSDPWVTREFRVIDLLAQRSGLPPYVIGEMVGLGYSADEMLAALRHEPVSGFRLTFGYQNVFHLEAARLVAAASGAPSWEAFLSDRVLQPLGMPSTTATEDGILRNPNHASGHAPADGTIRPIPLLPNFYAVGAAGNLNSSVNDMCRWLRMQINGGELQGRRIVGEKALKHTRIPQIPISPIASYASGWVVSSLPGGRVVWHNGSTPGFGSHVGFDPERRAGIVVLTSLGGKSPPGDAIAMRFHDLLQGNPERDYGSDMLAAADAGIAAEAKAYVRPVSAIPPRPLQDYAGAYGEPALGPATVSVDGDHLVLPLGPSRMPMTVRPWSGDVFSWHLPAGDARLAGSDPAGKVVFRTKADGSIAGFKLLFREDSAERDFTRRPS